MPPARCPGTTESVTHCHADFDEPLAYNQRGEMVIDGSAVVKKVGL